MTKVLVDKQHLDAVLEYIHAAECEHFAETLLECTDFNEQFHLYDERGIESLDTEFLAKFNHIFARAELLRRSVQEVQTHPLECQSEEVQNEKLYMFYIKRGRDHYISSNSLRLVLEKLARAADWKERITQFLDRIKSEDE